VRLRVPTNALPIKTVARSVAGRLRPRLAPSWLPLRWNTVPSGEDGFTRTLLRLVKGCEFWLLKNHLDLERDWSQAIARLNQVYTRL
jgi:hypothetical protein